MSESSDAVERIVASGREVVPRDVEPLWSDLLSGRATAHQTASRAQMLMETANATHVANWGLSSLHTLTFGQVPVTADVSAAHERWRVHVREYEADPEAWDRTYYQRMLSDFAEHHGVERARAFGGKLVRSGELREVDVAAVLEEPQGE